MRFLDGAIVRSKVDAQGLIEGQRYRVLRSKTVRNFTGGYISYWLEPCDRTIAAPNNPIGNGHLILEEVDQ